MDTYFSLNSCAGVLCQRVLCSDFTPGSEWALCSAGTVDGPIAAREVKYILIVYGTSNGPQNDIGNYSGPCSRP